MRTAPYPPDVTKLGRPGKPRGFFPEPGTDAWVAAVVCLREAWAPIGVLYDDELVFQTTHPTLGRAFVGVSGAGQEHSRANEPPSEPPRIADLSA